MCNRTQTAVEMAKNKKQLGKGEIVVMFQQVAIDLAKQGDRMSELEKQISDLKEQTNNGFAKTDKVLAVVLERIDELQKTIDSQKKPTFWEKIPLLKEIPPLGWIALIIVSCLIAALFGVDLTPLTNWIKWSGQ